MKSKLLALAVASLFVASMSLPVMTMAQLNPYTLPVITVTCVNYSSGGAPPFTASCTSNGLFNVYKVSGVGFSASDTIQLGANFLGHICTPETASSISAVTSCSTNAVSFSSSSGLVGSIAGASDGTFTTFIWVTGGSSGASVLTAQGTGGSKDKASSVINLSDIKGTSQSTTVTPTSSTASATFTPNSGTTASVSIAGTTSPVAAVVSELTSPTQGSGTASTAANTLYLDIHVSGTFPAGTTAHICVTNSVITSGYKINYWTGTAWSSVTTTVTGHTACADILVSDLTGTNIEVVPPNAANYTYVYLGAFVVVLLIIILFGLLLRRRKKEEPAPTS